MSVREQEILLPRKASDSNPDDWPEFKLTKVNITSQRTGQNASLLSAHQGNPVRVIGKLGAVDSELAHLVKDKKHQNKTIELENVSTYAFAEFEDGTCGFWAAGKAGWFEIQSPSAQYKTIHGKMNEAATIFYLLADKVKRSHHKNYSTNYKSVMKYAEKAFLEYFNQRKDPTCPADVGEARSAFREHREFLITSMLEGQDGIDWNLTPMLHFFKYVFPDDYQAVEAILLRPKKPIKADLEPIAPVPVPRETSRKRKSQSPQDGPSENKRRRRKAAQQADVRLQALPKGLLPKTPQSRLQEETPSSDAEDDGNINVFGHKHKSILRPSGHKSSKKAAARRRGLRNRNDSEDENDEEEDQAASSPITTLRNAKDLEILTNPPADNSSKEVTPEPKYLPRKYLELKVVEYDLPSTEPQGPGDLWTCTFDGCFHRVHEASTEDGKVRMREHFKSHASQAQEKIDLVLHESRPYLPVNNLMRRLQAFAPAADSEPDPNSLQHKFSAPIRRRY